MCMLSGDTHQMDDKFLQQMGIFYPDLTVNDTSKDTQFQDMRGHVRHLLCLIHSTQTTELQDALLHFHKIAVKKIKDGFFNPSAKKDCNINVFWEQVILTLLVFASFLKALIKHALVDHCALV